MITLVLGWITTQTNMTRLQFNLSLIFRPWLWLNAGTYSKEWDDMLSEILEDRSFSCKQVAYSNGNIVMINDVAVWVGNYPYCYGGPITSSMARIFELSNHKEYPEGDVIPSRYNSYRLYKRLNPPVGTDFNLKFNK